MLPGNRKFEVTLSDERIDLTKARRIEPRPPLPHLDPRPPAAGRARPRPREFISTKGADQSRLQMLGQSIVFRQLGPRSWRIVSACDSFQNFSVPLTRWLNCLTSDSTRLEVIGRPC